VRFGDRDISSRADDKNVLIRNVKRVSLHPNYRESQAYYDVGMIILDRAVIFSDFIQPVCLPLKSVSNPDVHQSKLVTLTGNQKIIQIASDSHFFFRLGINEQRSTDSRWNFEAGSPQRVLSEARIFAGQHDIKIFVYRFCNETHERAAFQTNLQGNVRKSVPNLFQGSIFCAGKSI